MHTSVALRTFDFVDFSLAISRGLSECERVSARLSVSVAHWQRRALVDRVEPRDTCWSLLERQARGLGCGPSFESSGGAAVAELGAGEFEQVASCEQ